MQRPVPMYQMMITEAFTQSYCSHISGKNYLTFLCRIAQTTADIPACHGSRFIFFGVAVTVLKDINIIRIFTAKFIQCCKCAVVEIKFTGFILYLAGHKNIWLNLADKVAFLFKFYIIPFQGQEKGRKQAQIKSEKKIGIMNILPGRQFNIDEFKNPANEYSVTYMWFWNVPVSKELIDRELREYLKAGITSLYIVPLPKDFSPEELRTYLDPEYLSDEFFDLVEYTLRECVRLGIKPWIYDEGGWPSGGACYNTVRQNPKAKLKLIKTRNNGSKPPHWS